MRTKLSKHWMDYLLTQPESGMGYQRVDVEMSDGTILSDCLVYNASEIELPRNEALKTIVKVSIHRSRSKG